MFLHLLFLGIFLCIDFYVLFFMYCFLGIFLCIVFYKEDLLISFKQKIFAQSANKRICSNKATKNYKYKKIEYLVGFVLTLSFIVFFFSFNSSYCFTPKIVNKLSQAFEDIEDWLIKLSTPAAAVAVGVGLFMKKFSFGDEERIRMSKKIIRGSLVSYALLLAVNLILAAIKSLID